jgi:hypothetical protein
MEQIKEQMMEHLLPGIHAMQEKMDVNLKVIKQGIKPTKQK